eukprot:246421_1
MSATPFIWKLPSMTLDTKMVICNKYIEANCSEHLPPEIIKLLAIFYTTDLYTVRCIKNASHLLRFKSPLFYIQGFLWYLDFYPNGSNDDNEGASILYLCLAVLPPKYLSIEVGYSLSLLETSTCCADRFAFNKDEAYDGWPRSVLKFNELQAESVQTLTFELEMDRIIAHKASGSMKIYNPDSKSYATDIPKQVTLKVSPYTWNITNESTVQWLKTAQIGQFVNGPLMTFGPFKLYLQFCPRGRNATDEEQVWIGLSVWYWPPKLRKALLQCKLLFHEMRCSKSGHKSFDGKHLCLGWCADISHEQLKQLTSFSFVAEVSVVSVFDTDGDVYAIQDEKDMRYTRNVTRIIRFWLRKLCLDEEYERYYGNMIARYVLCVEVHEFETLDINPSQQLVFTWKVHEDYAMNTVANACNLYCLPSHIFEAFGMKWYMGLWPSGSRVSRDGTVNVFVNLISFESKDQQIAIRFDISWIESDTVSSNYDTFVITANGGGETYWPLKSIDIASLKTMTIQLKLTMMEVLQNNTIRTYKYVEDGVEPSMRLVKCPKDVFEWKVSQMESELFVMFGMKWQLVLNTASEWTDLCLRIDELPATVVCVRYTVCIKECEFRYVACASFYEGVTSKGWNQDRLSKDKYEQLMAANGITLRLTLELVDVYSDQTNVTDLFNHTVP